MPDSNSALLQELVRLTRVLVQPIADQLMRRDFLDEEGQPRIDRLRVYARLDGRPQKESAVASGVNQSSVSRWSQEWKRKGLVADDGTAVFAVGDFFPELEKEISADVRPK